MSSAQQAEASIPGGYILLMNVTESPLVRVLISFQFAVESR